jgi:nucleotide sugar dehydrogenase
MKVAVVGLGKIGLPLAVHYASTGNDVVGIDVSRPTVDLVNAGTEPFPGEHDLDRLLKDVVGAGRLRATTDYAEGVVGADVILVLVPLVVDSDLRPDFSILDSSTNSIAEHLTSGTTVIYETTLPVGVTRERWKPMLEERSGLVEGQDFHVVFSPERVLTGRIFADLRKYPKLVGGLSADGTRAAVAFYEKNIDFLERPELDRANGVWDLGMAEAAELAKLAETTYRDVNIALANQFAKFADSHGIDVYGVIEASNSQPFSHIHRPGVSVGGHCIPVYPHLYLAGDESAELVAAARRANKSMPAHTVELLRQELGSLAGTTVAVLGAAYRAGVKETAFSGVFDLVALLGAEGATAVVHDPLYTDEELAKLALSPYHLGDGVDAAVVHTDHPEYAHLDVGTSLPGSRVLVDGRATFAGNAGDVRVRTLGRP